ncbi:sensor histidine kinase [Nocardiopsis halophila]|uniref:sensor histidine kinase n=1 Tax=Nocardiopsis halophila TaxID=141692 RepID=UPI00034BE7B9|nr:HAMP domain-containing sensor histidine kinase [Nocardiopsis halophila]
MRQRVKALAARLTAPERWRLGTKFAVAFAVVAAVASLLTGTLAYSTAAVLIRADAEDEFQTTAERLASDLSAPSSSPFGGGQQPTFLHSDSFTYQALSSGGSVAVPIGADRSVEVLPVRADDRVVAAEQEAGVVHTREDSARGEDYRIATVSLGGGNGAIQIGQRLSPMERMLDVLALQILVVGAGVLAVAAGAGWLLARRVTKRLVRLTDTAEQVRTTGRLDLVAPEGGTSPDEVGRLGRAFNAMLTRLAGAEAEQRRLVQNASHELRTPLTSLRTNVSVMRSFDRLGPEAQQRLVDDLQGETRELSQLVDELVQLATGTRADEAPADVELGALAERVAERARRRTGREVVVDADGSTVHGLPTALERALSNPVENAAKFDTDGAGPIEIVVREGRVEVRDRGPGIAPEEVDHVFERFYRSDSARALPGSGLGLSMVKEIVHAHGGTVQAANREGGGAVIGFTLPVTGERASDAE